MTSYRSHHLTRLRHVGLAVLATSALFSVLPDAAHAENLIKRPGAHNHYKFELEPQALIWYGWGDGRGAHPGLGLRAAIPFMHNGPIDTINNNIGISFGLNTVFPENSGGVMFTAPVAFQWNFYFLENVSVLGEVGLATNIWTGAGDGFDLDPLFQGGGRFQWGRIGVVVRIGYPSSSVGCNIQF